MTEIKFNIDKVFFFLLLFVIMITLSSCGKIDSRLKVTNGTNNAIYYELKFDSSYRIFFNEIQKIQYGFKNDTAPIKIFFKRLEPKNDTRTEIFHSNLENFLAANNESVWIFVLNDSLSNNQVHSLHDLKNSVLSRKSYSIEYLRKNNWIITISE